jgi:hypothetical protein
LALLKYDISVTGEQNVARALAGIERRFVQHNARIARVTGQKRGPAKQRSGGGVDPEITRSIRQQEQYWARAHQRSADHRIRQDNRATAVALRNAEREAKARTRAEAKAAKESLAARRRFSGAAFGTVGKSVKGTLAATGAIAGTTLGLAGGFAAAGAVQSEMSERAQASRLANQAGDPGSKGQLLKESRQVKGFTGGETLSAIEGFVTKTGDLTAARGLIQDMGQLALATGTDFGELGEAAGQAFNVIKDTITDPQERLKAVNDVMRTLAAQGNLGAVEIKDMASELAGLGAATRKFEGGPVELLKTMGAMAQLSVKRGGAASAAEATTAVTRFGADITKRPGQQALAAAGIDVFSDKGKTKLKDPKEIMKDILDKTGGDMTKIEGILNAESGKALAGVSSVYLDAESKKKGTGRAAVDAAFKEFTGASVSDKDISARANSRLDDSDLQFKEAMKDFNEKVGSELLPVLTRLIPQFTRLLPYIERAANLFGKLVEEFAGDPMAGIGKIIAAKLAFDIASAGIGKGLKDSLVAQVSGQGGIGNSITGALAAGLAVSTVILTAGVVNFQQKEADMSAAGADVRAGLESKDIAEVQARRESVEKKLAENKKGSFFDNTVGAITGAIGSSIDYGAQSMGFEGMEGSPDDVGKRWSNSVTNQETTTRSLEAMSEQLRAHEAALDRNSAALAKSGGAAPNRGNAPSPVKN